MQTVAELLSWSGFFKIDIIFFLNFILIIECRFVEKFVSYLLIVYK